MKSQGAIILTADTSVKTMGLPITFTVKDDQGNDVTADATILVDNAAIEGNVYTAETVSTHEVTAQYDGLVSAPLSVRFHDGSEVNFVKRMLIEDYTGTWCGFCPRIAYSIEQAKAQSDKVISVAIHRSSDNPNSPNYDPYNYDSSELENLLPAVGYPKGYLNRMTEWSFPQQNNLQQVIEFTQGDNPKLGLAINGTITGSNLSLTVDTQFAKDFSNLKLVVYVLEDGLIHEQHNYTTFYEGPNTIEDFEHDHVLRACLTPILGEAVSNSETVIGNVYTKTYNIAVPAKVSNTANVEFVAFIVDATGSVVNVRKAAIGETQTFEEL
jgi:thiol-disulfide isomerase/thioredoxin